MGGTSWSDRDYQDRQSTRAATGQSAFQHDAAVKASGRVVIHAAMDLKGKIRESRDSDAHPKSHAIAVVFDVTGSMGGIPVILQKKLGQLMRVLLTKNYVSDPQILFGAVGDASGYAPDLVPLQIGQFESGLEMDDDLGKIILEGGGGGQNRESYELLPYVFARKTSIDCFEKRGDKGYLFTIGDERPYLHVSAAQVEALIGDKLEADITLEQMVKEVEAKYHWFHIVATTGTSQGCDAVGVWKGFLGERVLELPDPAAVCETIAMTIGLVEGGIDDLQAGADDLASHGLDKGALAHAANALVPYSTSTSRAIVGRVASSNLPAAGASAGDGRVS
jgi:hypothetical protein